MDSLFDIMEARKTKDICLAFSHKYSTKKDLKEEISKVLGINKDAIEKNIKTGNLSIIENNGVLSLNIENERWFDEIIQKRILNKLRTDSFPNSIIIPNSIIANSFYEGVKDFFYDIKYSNKQIEISLLSEITFKDCDVMFYSCLCSFWEQANEKIKGIDKLKVSFSDIYKFINADITDVFLSSSNQSSEIKIPIEFKNFLQRMLDINSLIRKSISLGVDPVKCSSYIVKNGEKSIVDKKSISSILSFSLEENGIVLLQKPQLLELNDFISNHKIILDRKKAFNWKGTVDLQSVRFEILKRIYTSKCKRNRMNPSITKKWWEKHFTKINYNSDSLGFFFKRLEKEKEISNLEFPKGEEIFVKWKSIAENENLPRNNKYRASEKENKNECNKRNNAPDERTEIQSSKLSNDLKMEI